MTREQEQIAEKLIDLHKQAKGLVNLDYWSLTHTPFDKTELFVIAGRLIEMGLLEYLDVEKGNHTTRITEKGEEFPGFEEYKKQKKLTRDQEETIRAYTVMQLKYGVFKVKYWWVLLIISGIIGFVTGNFEHIVRWFSK